jgi:hypothetical protein
MIKNLYIFLTFVNGTQEYLNLNFNELTRASDIINNSKEEFIITNNSKFNEYISNNIEGISLNTFLTINVAVSLLSIFLMYFLNEEYEKKLIESKISKPEDIKHKYWLLCTSIIGNLFIILTTTNFINEIFNMYHVYEIFNFSYLQFVISIIFIFIIGFILIDKLYMDKLKKTSENRKYSVKIILISVIPLLTFLLCVRISNKIKYNKYINMKNILKNNYIIDYNNEFKILNNKKTREIREYLL